MPSAATLGASTSATASPTTVDVSTADFERAVLEESHRRPVVVDFWAPWCGPCRMLGPVLEGLAREDAGAWLLAKVNSDENPELSARFSVSGIPAVKAVYQGEVIGDFVGARPPQQVRAWLDEILPSEADEVVDDGVAALRAGDLTAARHAFAAALALDDAHPGAALGLARVAASEGALDEAEALIQALPRAARDRHERLINGVQLQIDAARAGDEQSLIERLARDPKDHDARMALGRQQAAAGDWAAAFESWLEVVRLDRGAHREDARKAMVAGFATSDDKALVKRWQTLLGLELFV